MMVRRHPVPTKVLAIPTSGKQSAFDEVVDIALTGAFCGLSVCVMCLTEEMLERWRSRLEDLSHPVTLLDVLNTNRARMENVDPAKATSRPSWEHRRYEERSIPMNRRPPWRRRESHSPSPMFCER
jgi:hypothetical protein